MTNAMRPYVIGLNRIWGFLLPTSLKHRVLLLLVVAVAMAVRLPPITEGLPNDELSTGYYRSIYSMWIDEAEPLFAVYNLHPARLDFDPDIYLTGTLQVYLYALGLQAAAFVGAVDLVSDKDYYRENPSRIAPLYIVGRAITFIFGVGTVFAVFLLSRQLYASDGVGILSALFLALLPTHVLYSFVLKSDGISVFFVVMTAVFSTGILKSGGWRWYVLAGLSAGLAASAKATGASAVIFVALAHVLRIHSELYPTGHLNGQGLFQRLVHSIRASMARRKIFLAAIAAIGGMFIGFPYLFLAPGDVAAYFYADPGGRAIHGFNLNESGTWIPHLFNMVTNMGPLILTLSLLGVVLMLLRRNPTDLLLGLWAVTFFVLLGFTQTGGMDRATLPLSPILAIAAAQVCMWTYQKVRHRSSAARIAAVAALSLVVIYNLGLTWSYVEVMADEDVRFKATRWITQNVVPGSSIGYDSAGIYAWHSPESTYTVEPDQPEGMSLSKYDVILVTSPLERYADNLAIHLENSSRLTPLRLGRVLEGWEAWYTWDIYIYTRTPMGSAGVQLPTR